MKVYNTLSRQIEEFKEIKEGHVKLYCCGPTVYNYAHIGNLRTFIFEDVLKRTLTNYGYKVKHVMNITDVGHLTGDGDDGDDKMKKRSQETGRSVYEIADFYTKAFFADEEALNIIRPDIVCKATDHIQDMIDIVKLLEEKGHTYMAGGNVYFSIDTIDDYGKLARLNLEDLKEGARIQVDLNKKNPKDFVLWFTNSKFKDQAMIWPSPWGIGYPGWHLECSAMSYAFLGKEFDMHCGGIDAISVHHTNEIAQSEAAFGIKPWVKYWLHGEFLLNDTGKMSKSSGEFLTLPVVVKNGYDALDYRYFCLSGHYRSQLKFSYEALGHAKSARKSLNERVLQLKESQACALSEKAKEYQTLFFEAFYNDLKAPLALSYLWQMLKDNTLADGEKLALVLEMDEILGLDLAKLENNEEHSDELLNYVNLRAEAKKNKDFASADKYRDLISNLGYTVKDTPQGPVLEKK